MRKILLLLLPIAALGFAPAPVFRERPIDPDSISKMFQGRWRTISYSKDGREIPNVSPYQNRIEKNRWEMFGGTPKQNTESYTITLDTKSVPMRINWFEPDGTHCSKSIFELTKDRLHYSFRPVADGCPRSLAAPSPKDYVVVLVRD